VRSRPSTVVPGLRVHPPPPPSPLSVGVRVKVAITLRPWVMLTVPVSVPVHPSPLQPLKVESLAAVAVSVTLVPKSKAALQLLPQLTPVGVLVTVPLPVPAWMTVRMTCWKVMAKTPPSVPA
jgi:hypothetical protein